MQTFYIAVHSSYLGTDIAGDTAAGSHLFDVDSKTTSGLRLLIQQNVYLQGLAMLTFAQIAQ